MVSGNLDIFTYHRNGGEDRFEVRRTCGEHMVSNLAAIAHVRGDVAVMIEGMNLAGSQRFGADGDSIPLRPENSAVAIFSPNNAKIARLTFEVRRERQNCFVIETAGVNHTIA